MEHLVSALWLSLDTAAVFLFLSGFLKRKQTGRKYILAVCTAAILLIISAYMEGVLGPFYKLLMNIILFLFAAFLFHGKWYVRLFLQLAAVLFSSLMDAAVMYGISWLLGVSVNKLIWMQGAYIASGMLSKLIVVFLYWLLGRVRSVGNADGLQGKWFLLTILFPAVSLVMLALCYYNNQGNAEASKGVLWLSLVMAFANIGILYLIQTLQKVTAREQEAALLEQQIRHQRENFAALESSYRTQRKSVHEFERHLQTLSVLLEKGEGDTASQYVAQLQKNRNLRPFSIVSRHPVVDVILNQKYQLAREQNISMQVTVNDLSAITLQTDELVVLLGNLLDNAMEACRKTDGRREILCEILLNESLYISVRNVSPPVEITDGEIKVESKDRDHGYGIPAMRYILNRLQAEYTFAYADGWFQFAADIPIA